MGLSKYIYLVGFTVLSLLIGIVYFQNSKIDNMNKEIQVLNIAVESSNAINEGLRTALKSNEIVNKKLNTVNLDIKKQLSTIKKHDLENLAIKKPKLLERRINNASDKIWLDIACYSDTSRMCN